MGFHQLAVPPTKSMAAAPLGVEVDSVERPAQHLKAMGHGFFGGPGERKSE